MQKQYIIQKYVMADSVVEALKKSEEMPVHEVFVHNAWFEKVPNFNFFDDAEKKPGFLNSEDTAK